MVWVMAKAGAVLLRPKHLGLAESRRPEIGRFIGTT
jgi:hypothetical protein